VKKLPHLPLLRFRHGLLCTMTAARAMPRRRPRPRARRLPKRPRPTRRLSQVTACDRAGHPQERPAFFFSPILQAMMKLCRGSLVALLLASSPAAPEATAEKGSSEQGQTGPRPLPRHHRRRNESHGRSGPSPNQACSGVEHVEAQRRRTLLFLIFAAIWRRIPADRAVDGSWTGQGSMRSTGGLGGASTLQWGLVLLRRRPAAMVRDHLSLVPDAAPLAAWWVSSSSYSRASAS